jgi:hypothetical protein
LRSNTPKSSSTLLTPYINDATKYIDSYDVFIPVHDVRCGLIFTTTEQPCVEHYFISFKDYVRDNNAYSFLEEKKIIMNYSYVQKCHKQLRNPWNQGPQKDLVDI